SYSQLISSGGIKNTPLINTWVDFSYYLDNSMFKEAFTSLGMKDFDGLPMSLIPGFVPGLKIPADRQTYKRARADHKNNFTGRTLPDIFYASDGSAEGISLNEVTKLIDLKDKIREAQIPTYTFCGWFDAGVAEGSIQKFTNIDSPQQLVILPSDHQLSFVIDPYSLKKPLERDPLKSVYSISRKNIFSRYLENESERPERNVKYYTFGVNKMQQSAVWPPENLTDKVLYMSDNGLLNDKLPDSKTGSDHYKVDFSATNGLKNRWMNQVTGDLVFTDRRSEGRKLLTYTSAPLEQPLEVTGTVTVNLNLSSNRTDGAFYVYLEDVSPAGEVVYLTEGALRGVHRKIIPEEEAPLSVPQRIYHSYRTEDMEDMKPGDVTEI
ncbi:MAG: CocE/NonD family hydrolase, partial [Proteobacteria bacterium]|nr:CocE/NonD family hydrolase [Pseudomonadota bacterium]